MGDLSQNPRRALFLVGYVIVGAGFCEELVFRGYLFERLARLLGQEPVARLAMVLLGGAFFAINHFQQGFFGIEQAAILGTVVGAVYLFSNKNLWLLIVIHSTFDLSAVALNYLHLDSALAYSFFR